MPLSAEQAPQGRAEQRHVFQTSYRPDIHGEHDGPQDVGDPHAVGPFHEVPGPVERGSEEKTFQLTPMEAEDGRYIIGVTSKVSHNALTAVKNGAKGTWSMTKSMFSALGQLVSGKVSTDEISGPVGIVSLVSETKNYGMIYLYLKSVV